MNDLRKNSVVMIVYNSPCSLTYMSLSNAHHMWLSNHHCLMTPWPTNKCGLWLSKIAFSQERDTFLWIRPCRERGRIGLGHSYCTPDILKFILHINSTVLTISVQSISKLVVWWSESPITINQLKKHMFV